MFCGMYMTQSLSGSQTQRQRRARGLFKEPWSSSQGVLCPWGTSARGRDCHANQCCHTGCSVTAYDLTQQKKLLFPHMKDQRKKNPKTLTVRHLTSAAQDLKRRVPTTMVQVDLKRTCQLKKTKCKMRSGSCIQF